MSTPRVDSIVVCVTLAPGDLDPAPLFNLGVEGAGLRPVLSALGSLMSPLRVLALGSGVVLEAGVGLTTRAGAPARALVAAVPGNSLPLLPRIAPRTSVGMEDDGEK